MTWELIENRYSDCTSFSLRSDAGRVILNDENGKPLEVRVDWSNPTTRKEAQVAKVRDRLDELAYRFNKAITLLEGDDGDFEDYADGLSDEMVEAIRSESEGYLYLRDAMLAASDYDMGEAASNKEAAKSCFAKARAYREADEMANGMTEPQGGAGGWGNVRM